MIHLYSQSYTSTLIHTHVLSHIIHQAHLLIHHTHLLACIHIFSHIIHHTFALNFQITLALAFGPTRSCSLALTHPHHGSLSLARFPLFCSFSLAALPLFWGVRHVRRDDCRIQASTLRISRPPSHSPSLFLNLCSSNQMHPHVFLFIGSPSLFSCSWVLLFLFFLLEDPLGLSDRHVPREDNTVHHAADTACLIPALSFSSTLAF